LHYKSNKKQLKNEIFLHAFYLNPIQMSAIYLSLSMINNIE